jgi:hypothetical protein
VGLLFEHGIRVDFTNSVLQLCALDGAPGGGNYPFCK